MRGAGVLDSRCAGACSTRAARRVRLAMRGRVLDPGCAAGATRDARA